MQVVILVLLLFIIGVALLLFGHRIAYETLPLVGFLAGFWLGAELTAQILNTTLLGNLAGWIAGIGVGVLIALLAHFLHDLKFGIIGAVYGYWMGSGFMAAIGFRTGFFTILVGLIAAAIVAALFYLLDVKRFVAMASTSVIGAYAILIAIMLMFGRVSLPNLEAANSSIGPVLQDSWVWLIIWAALAVFGFVFQDREHKAVALAHGD